MDGKSLARLTQVRLRWLGPLPLAFGIIALAGRCLKAKPYGWVQEFFQGV